MTVEVGVRELRTRLAYWLDRAAAGDTVLVTERGKPVAKLTAAEGRDRLIELIEAGIVRPPLKPKGPAPTNLPRVDFSLTDYVLEQRRR